ncbi:MAG: 2'-5' RNA ligase family protein [Candidatus Aenigmatarchaeota archaeon]
MPMKEGYAVWIIPTGEAYCRLCMSISNISNECSTPNFEPHLTLAYGIKGGEDDVKGKTKKLAEELQPFRIKLDGIGRSSERFRALYLNVEENELITEAIDTAEKFFGKECKPGFKPQIGLLYGDVNDEKKIEIAEKYVRYGNLAFVAERLYLWEINNGPETWKEVADYELG